MNMYLNIKNGFQSVMDCDVRLAVSFLEKE